MAKNSALFAIGNFGSKLISFVMLPLYTSQLNKTDFGMVDLVITTTALFLPIISLSIFDAVLRFTMESKSDKQSIFVNSLFVTLIGCLVLLLILPLLILVFKIPYVTYMCIILLVQSFQSLFSQYSKAIGEIRIFAINGMLLSFFTAILNVFFLSVFNLGIEGYLLSIVLANLLSNTYLWGRLKLKNILDFSKVSKKEIKRLLIYSTPLIPNGIAWWVNNAINRYFILFFIGTTGNGLFAVANKIPALLNIINSIFFQAWQLSVIEEYDKRDSSSYYSKVFDVYSRVLFIGTSGLLLILKPMMSVLVSKEFGDAWKFVPFLLVTVIYSSFSSFYGNYYSASKKTSGAFYTTIYGSVINIVGNFILIPIWGLQGAGISSIVSFLSLWIIRHYTTQKLVTTNLNYLSLTMNHLVLIIQIVTFYFFSSYELYLYQSICLVLVLLINKEVLLSISKKNSVKLY